MNPTYSAASPSNVSVTATITTPGVGDDTLIAVRATIDASTATGPVFLQVFEGNSFPNENDVPVISVPMQDGHAVIQFGAYGRKMSGACAVLISAAPLEFIYPSKIGGGNLTALIDVQYL